MLHINLEGVYAIFSFDFSIVFFEFCYRLFRCYFFFDSFEILVQIWPFMFLPSRNDLNLAKLFITLEICGHD